MKTVSYQNKVDLDVYKRQDEGLVACLIAGPFSVVLHDCRYERSPDKTMAGRDNVNGKVFDYVESF